MAPQRNRCGGKTWGESVNFVPFQEIALRRVVIAALLTGMTQRGFFGYGSLVNRATHGYRVLACPELPGWRREWCQTGTREFSFLSARRDASAAISGLVAEVPDNDWAALDEREFAYEKSPLANALSHLPLTDIQIYSVPDANHKPAPCPILLSYLDVVVQGFLAEFGPEGVANFFTTTTGWHVGVLDDRAAPIYPRHQNLARHETALVDRHLAALSA